MQHLFELDGPQWRCQLRAAFEHLHGRREVGRGGEGPKPDESARREETAGAQHRGDRRRRARVRVGASVASAGRGDRPDAWPAQERDGEVRL